MVRTRPSHPTPGWPVDSRLTRPSTGFSQAKYAATPLPDADALAVRARELGAHDAASSAGGARL